MTLDQTTIPIFLRIFKTNQIEKNTKNLRVHILKTRIRSFEIGCWIRWAYCNFDREKEQNDIIEKVCISTTDEKYTKHHFLFTSYKAQRIWEPISTNRGVHKQYFSLGRGIHKLHSIIWKGYFIIQTYTYFIVLFY